MSIAIYCKDRRSWVANAQAAANGVIGVSEVTVLDLNRNEVAKELGKHASVVAHVSDEQWTTLTTGPFTTIKLIVRVSSVGTGEIFKAPHRLNSTGPWILHLIERSDEVTTDEWKAIFKAIKNWDTAKDELPRDVAAIFDPHPEYRLALRLLCEAWMFIAEKKTVDGITIHAPATPSDWFKPFEKLPPSRPRDTTEDAKKHLENELAPLAGLMGDAEREALNLLTAVVNGADLKTPVDKFLSTFQGTKQAATNPVA